MAGRNDMDSSGDIGLQPIVVTNSSNNREETKASSQISASSPSKDDKEKGVARWRELYFIYAAIVADGIASNIMVAYGTVWVRDNFHMKNVGFYSGLLIGVFSFTVALSAPFLGWWSDMIGRRYLLIMGLASVATFELIGGMVGNYWVSVAMHGLAGLLDSTQSVSYAAIGDLAKGPARQVAFGFSSVAFQVARILSSVIGGLTYGVEPKDHMGLLFEKLPGQGKSLISHLIASALCIIVMFLIIAFYVEEPPESECPRYNENLLRRKQSTAVGEEPSLEDLEGREGLYVSSVSSSPMPPPEPKGLVSLASSVIEPVERVLVRRESVWEPPPEKPTFWEGLQYVSGEPLLMRLILVYSLSNFLNGELLYAIPLLAEDYDGFDLKADETGFILLFFGCWCIFFNFLFFKPIVK